MNVGELRAALVGVPDDMIVMLGYDDGPQDSGPASEAKVFEPSFGIHESYFLVPEAQA